LSWEFLVQADWFGRWLQVEKDCEFASHHPKHISRRLTCANSCIGAIPEHRGSLGLW
jgi:hypothetical protein